MLGVAGSALFLALLVCAVIVSLRPDWARIAVRALGSWVAAVRLLTFG
jgi:hypothetical protein